MKFQHKILRQVIFMIACGSTLHAQSQKTWQWVNQIGGSSWDLSGGLACDTKDNIYITGSFIDTLFCNNKKLKSFGNQDFFIARYNSKGDLKDLWNGGGKERDLATCITVVQDNSIVVGGMITGDVVFNKVDNAGKGMRLFLTCLSEKGKFSWITSFTTTNDASLFLIDADAKGNIYASGVFTGTIAHGDLSVTSAGRKDIFIAKVDAAGNLVRLIALGGEENDALTALSVSDSGQVHLAGITQKTFSAGNYEIAAKKQNQATSINSNAFIIGYNNNLDAQWKTQFIGDEYCQVSALKRDKENNLYISGSFNQHIQVEDSTLTSNGYSDGFLMKYNPAGKLLWARNFGSWFYDYANHMVVDNLGGTIITGSIGDTLVIDSLSVNPVSSNNSALVIQFSPDGKAIWADCISGSGRNFGDGATIDFTGNLYLTGTFREIFQKEGSNTISHGDQDVFIAKYFNCLNSKTEIMGDTVICPESSTQLYIKNGYSKVTWNDSISNTNTILASVPGKYHVRMIDKRGCVLSDTVEVTLANSSQFSLGDDLSVPIEDAILLKAPEKFTNYRWQDNSSDNVFTAKAEKENSGIYTFWLSAMDATGCIASDTIHIEFFISPGWIDESNITLNAFPNPVSDKLYWSVDTEKPCQFIVEIADDNGRIVYFSQVKNYQPDALMTVDFSDFPPGPYYLRIKGRNGQAFRSICIVRK